MSNKYYIVYGSLLYLYVIMGEKIKNCYKVTYMKINRKFIIGINNNRHGKKSSLTILNRKNNLKILFSITTCFILISFNFKSSQLLDGCKTVKKKKNRSSISPYNCCS